MGFLDWLTGKKRQPQQPQPQQQQRPQAPRVNVGALQRALNGASRVYDQVNPLDGGRTFKQRTPVKKTSAFQQATHNAVTNVAGDAVKFVPQFAANTNNAIANLAAKAANNTPVVRAGGAGTGGRQIPQRTIQQNLGTDPFSRGVVRVSGATGTNRQLAGNVAQIGASIIPGAGKGLTAGIAKALPSAAPKVIPRAIAGGLVGAPTGAAGNVAVTISNDKVPLTTQNIVNSAKSGAIAGAIGGAAIPVAGAVAKQAAPVVVKGAQKTAKAAQNVNAKAFTPRASLEDQLTLKDYSNYLAGAYKPQPRELTPLLQKVREIGDKHGVNLKSGTVADLHTRTNAILDQIGKKNRVTSEGGYLNVGGKNASPKNATGTVPEQSASIPNTNQVSPASLPTSVAPVKVKPNAPELALASDAAPPMKPPTQALASPAGDMQVPPSQNVALNIPGKKTRFAAKTVPESQFVGEKVSSQTKVNAPTYNPETERGRFSQTLKSADQKGFDSFENDVWMRLNQKHIDSQTATDGIAVAQRLEAKGDDNSFRRAADIYDKLSEHLTKSGQTVQAAAILARRSPQGMKYQALKDLQKSGVKITPELQRKIGAHVDALTKTNPGSIERKKAIGTLAREVEKNTPNGAVSNLVSVWKAGLLSGVKTTGGNILSNATFGTLKKASDPITLLTDKGISLFTGKRSITGTQKGVVSGTKEGIQHGMYTFKTGVDIRNVSDKYETHAGINFKNPVVQKVLGNPAQKVFNFMSAQDQPFYFSQLKNSLYDLAKTDGLNRGLNGRALNDHMDSLVRNPTEAIMQRASDEANKAVLGFDTLAYKFVQGGKNAIDRTNAPEPVKQIARGVADVLMPFVRVPTAFLSRTIDFTPLGISRASARTVYDKIKGDTFDQRALSKAIGEGLTGTGLLAVGTLLAKQKQLSGDYPNDPKEQARWKAEGIQPNSVKFGDTWVSLNYLGPVGMLLSAGKKFEDTKDDGESFGGAALQAAGGFGQTLMGQSFLQGLSGFTDAINDPQRNLKSFVNSQAGSVVPSIVNDLGNMTDSYQRQVDGATEAVKNRIPGLRQTNKVKQDVYGNPLKQATDGVNRLSPFKPSDTNNSPTLDEVRRLHDVDPNNKDLQVTPTPIDKSLSIEGNQVRLNDSQRYDLQKLIGQATQQKWGELIQTPDYQALSDTDKAKALNSLRSDISTLTQRQYIVDNNLGTFSKSPSSAIQALALGKSNLADYATNTKNSSANTVRLATGLDETSKKFLTKYNSMSTQDRDKASRTQNDFDYNYLVAKYSNDLKSGKLSKAEDIKARDAINKARIGKDYSKDIRELYELSKSNIYDFITSDPQGKKYADELLAYDKALYDSGVGKSLKFKYGFGDKGGKGGRGRSAGKGSKKSTADLPARISLKVKRPSVSLKATQSKMASFKPAPSAAPRQRKIKATLV